MKDFKVMFGNRVYVGVGATILGLFAILTLMGMSIEATGDSVCAGTIENPCISYFNVTNNNYRSVYIYNYDEIKMDFSPEIKDYKLYVKYYGKWRFTNFTMETRLGNIPKDRKYVFVFPAYSTKQFKLVGYKKNPADKVKWGFGVGDDYLDPVWLPVGNKLQTIKKCHTYYWNTTEQIYDTRKVWNKGNKTYGYEQYLKDTKIIEHSSQICNTILYKYKDEIFNASDWCCYNNLCGLRKDYDCNYITKQDKRPEWSWKELNTSKVQINAFELEREYSRRKAKLLKLNISEMDVVMG